MKKTSGITLIALVITIIVLLILAGVSISAITGENGIVKKAKDAAEKTESASKEESGALDEYEQYIDSSVKGNENVIPDVLKTYILGEDGNGRFIEDMITGDESGIQFIDDDVLDASTSIKTFLPITIHEETYIDIVYDDAFYQIYVDETGYTKKLEKYNLQSIYSSDTKLEGMVDGETMGVQLDENLGDKLVPWKKYMIDCTINGEQKIGISQITWFLNILQCFELEDTACLIVENMIVFLGDSWTSDSYEVVINNIYEIGDAVDCVEEDGFVLGYQEENGWLLSSTPSTDYVIPETVDGIKIDYIFLEMLSSAVPTFSHIVDCRPSDIVQFKKIKITVKDNEYINEMCMTLSNGLTCPEVDIDLTECGDDIVFSDEFFEAWNTGIEDNRNREIFVTSEVKNRYQDYDFIVAQ